MNGLVLKKRNPEQLIAVKVPRGKSNHPNRRPKANVRCDALRKFIQARKKSIVRGKGKLVLGGDYACGGAVPCRNKDTIKFFQFEKAIMKEFRFANRLFKECMESNTLRAIEEKIMTVAPHLLETKMDTMHTSLGAGLNVFLSQHTDADAVFSIVAVHCSDPRCLTPEGYYKLDAEIACYFVFGETGKAIALRPGDYLIFNTLEVHSISRRTDFKSISFY